MSADAEWLPPPNEPAAFESLCLDLWKELWSDPGAEKNGRSGQPQAGVDIFCQRDGKWLGVQCKQKNGLLRKKVLSKELEAEVQAAKQFKPPLTCFILATSGPADSPIQTRARKLTEQHQSNGLFTVEVWSWEKIWHELHGRRQLLQRIQPVYWPTVGMKRESERPTFDRHFVRTAILILAAYALITAACYLLFGKEVTAIIGGGLTAICVGIHRSFPRLKFERVADSQKQIVAVQRLSCYVLFNSLCIFLGTQVACSVTFGMVLGIWTGLVAPHSLPLSNDPSFQEFFKAVVQSPLLNLIWVSAFLSYFAGGFFVGKTARTSPHTYAILGAFLYAVLTIGTGLLLLSDLEAFLGLFPWPASLVLRQFAARIGLVSFFFVWLSWVGAWLAVRRTPKPPLKKQRS